MKITIIPRKIEDLKLDKYDAYIVGLKKYSTNYDVEVDIEEIKELKKKYLDKEIFVALNKNLFNDELDEVERLLKELDEIQVNGILFYDLSILYLHKKNNLKVDLVWNQTHMVTNYNTCNYYLEKGVKYAFLASEITLEEILEIKEKSKMKFFALGFGYPIMAHSRRSLLTNYFKSKNLDNDCGVHVLNDRNGDYYIKEDETGTSILYGNMINGSCLLDSNIDYLVVNLSMISDSVVEGILDNVNDYLENGDKKILDNLEELVGKDTGFFFKKTIFKVKKSEKK